MTPLKSKIVDGSRPPGWGPVGSVGNAVPSTGPGKKKWRLVAHGIGTPGGPRVVTCGIGSGSGHFVPGFLSSSSSREGSPCAGGQRPEPSTAPATPAEGPKKRPTAADP